MHGQLDHKLRPLKGYWDYTHEERQLQYELQQLNWKMVLHDVKVGAHARNTNFYQMQEPRKLTLPHSSSSPNTTPHSEASRCGASHGPWTW